MPPHPDPSFLFSFLSSSFLKTSALLCSNPGHISVREVYSSWGRAGRSGCNLAPELQECRHFLKEIHVIETWGFMASVEIQIGHMPNSTLKRVKKKKTTTAQLRFPTMSF